jgi:murein tripeptide amidase MpaA
MRLIVEIDEAIAKYSDIVKTYQEMRTTLLVYWRVNGDGKQYRNIMRAERDGESWFKCAAQVARAYFKRLKEYL